MRLSHCYIPLLRDNPADATVTSHRLMLRAGMICQLSAGSYSWLPLGLRVLDKVMRVIDEEMHRIGGQKVMTPHVQPAGLWQESGRYNDYGKEMLRMQDRHDNPLLFGPTAEESVTDLLRHHAVSYKQLPLLLYQITAKYRDEIRPRFGVMRGREFMMKDAYSFDHSKDSAVETYMRVLTAYLRIFHRLGVRALPVRANTGPIGGDHSHEFHIMADTGESEIFFDRAFETLDYTRDDITDRAMALYSAADEKHNPSDCPVPAEQLCSRRGIEVGHIFYFGTKYSAAMKACYTAEDGSLQPFEMGSYGIGVSRVVAAIIEASHDDKGIIWPKAVAPFDLSLLSLNTQDSETMEASQSLYTELTKAGLDVLWDDTPQATGAKFASADLIGLPWQIILSPKTLATQSLEIKERATGNREHLPLNDLKALLAHMGVAPCR